jgi:hypothetical protein
MSYDYDFNTILKSALLKNNCSNKSLDAFGGDCMYAPFTNTNNDGDSILECTPMSMMYKNKDSDDEKDSDKKSYIYEGYNYEGYNYESLIEGSLIEEKDIGEVRVEVQEDSSNFFMQGSMKDNYKFVDNNFKEIAEKILLDINCDEDILNREVVNYEQQDNDNNSNSNSNIKKIVRMYNDINKKIDTLRIEINAIQTLESNLQTIIDNLKISNGNSNSSIENKIKSNMSNVIYYNTYFKFIVYLKQQKNMLEDGIDNEQLNLNAIMYIVMKNKWFEIAPSVYKLFNQHLPC